MKNIPTDDKFPDINAGKTGVTFCGLLVIALRAPPNNNGVDVMRVMKHFPIIQRLEAVGVNAEIQLSKEDWATVDSAWKEKKWPFVADSIGNLSMALEIEMKSTCV